MKPKTFLREVYNFMLSNRFEELVFKSAIIGILLTPFLLLCFLIYSKNTYVPPAPIYTSNNVQVREDQSRIIITIDRENK